VISGNVNSLPYKWKSSIARDKRKRGYWYRLAARPLDTPGQICQSIPMPKKTTPAKKKSKPKRQSRPDFAQNALASVEKAIGGKLADGMAVKKNRRF